MSFDSPDLRILNLCFLSDSLWVSDIKEKSVKKWFVLNLVACPYKCFFFFFFPPQRICNSQLCSKVAYVNSQAQSNHQYSSQSPIKSHDEMISRRQRNVRVIVEGSWKLARS